MASKKYFGRASRLFLTEELSEDEFNKILQKGEAIPKCEYYENESADFIEKAITETSEVIEEEVDKVLFKVGTILSYDDKDNDEKISEIKAFLKKYHNE